MFTKNIKRVYLIGIKGTGMSSLAVILKKLGYAVSGSDTAEKFFTESQLRQNHIGFREEFRANNLLHGQPELVIFSTAYNDRHPEIVQAKKLGLPLLSYPEAIGWLISQWPISVAVSGSHGKTTTTSMLGTIIENDRPTLTLTDTVDNQLKNKARHPRYFVFEADEYQNKFQHYRPRHFVLTNIDFDHPDFFKNARRYRQIFQDFSAKILRAGGTILYGHDSLPARLIFKNLKGSVESFGFGRQADYQITHVNASFSRFSVFHKNKEILDISLTVYGRHNILNATAAAIMAWQLGLPPKIIQTALKKFKGVKRRMEIIPSKKYLLMDDYAHHPTEIQATLSAVRHRYPHKKIVAVFHPHTFTRTQTFLKNFGRSFQKADKVIVLDIYGSARETQGRIHARDVVREIEKNGPSAAYQPTIKDAAAYIKKNIPRHSLIITIGAGDVWKLTKLIK